MRNINWHVSAAAAKWISRGPWRSQLSCFHGPFSLPFEPQKTAKASPVHSQTPCCFELWHGTHTSHGRWALCLSRPMLRCNHWQTWLKFLLRFLFQGARVAEQCATLSVGYKLHCTYVGQQLSDRNACCADGHPESISAWCQCGTYDSVWTALHQHSPRDEGGRDYLAGCKKMSLILQVKTFCHRELLKALVLQINQSNFYEMRKFHSNYRIMVLIRHLCAWSAFVHSLIYWG